MVLRSEMCSLWSLHSVYGPHDARTRVRGRRGKMYEIQFCLEYKTAFTPGVVEGNTISNESFISILLKKYDLSGRPPHCSTTRYYTINSATRKLNFLKR